MANGPRVSARGRVYWQDNETGYQLPPQDKSYRAVRAPTWQSFKTAHWIKGGTLERVVLRKGTSTVMSVGANYDCWVKLPSKKMLTGGCDRCAGPHDSKNTVCSQSLGIPTTMTDETSFYDYHTGKKIPYRLEVLEYISSSRKVHEATYFCTSQL